MVKIGNFLFHYRNGLFPLAYGVLLFDQSRMWNNDLLAALVGFGVAMSGQVLRALSIGLVYVIRGGKNRTVYAETLVTEGMFAHCRNPLYLGNFIIIAGLAIAANSILFLAIGLPFFLFAYRAIIAAEENYLGNMFGTAYSEYCSRVNRIIPNFSGFRATLQKTVFKWKRLVSADYGSIFSWNVGIICFYGKNVWLHTGYDNGRRIFLVLGVLLVLLIIAYATSRYLKISGKLQPSQVR